MRSTNHSLSFLRASRDARISLVNFLPIIFLFHFTICSLHAQKGASSATVNAKQTAYNRPKMAKTQGSSEFANIRCGLQDKQGNLWFGTIGEGVYRYSGNSFTQFTVLEGLCNNTVWSIMEDEKGNIWFGTDDGLCRYDGKSIVKIPVEVKNSPGFFPVTTASPSAKFSVWSLFQDRSGKIWLGTSNGVVCYDRKEFSFFLNDNRLINKDALKLTTISQILEDKKGNIWFCSGIPAGEEGACRFDGKNLESFKPYGDKWVRGAVQSKDGNLYFITRHHGVCKFDGSAFTNISAKGGINNSSVTCIFEDKRGQMWFGTELGSGQLGEDGGVWRFDGTDFTRFTTKEGLVHNGVWCITEDKDGNLWFGTRNNSLCSFDGKNFTKF